MRQALGLPKTVVLGHSFGATTALAYAALFPASTEERSVPTVPTVSPPVGLRVEATVGV